MQHKDLFEFTEWASFNIPPQGDLRDSLLIGVDHISGRVFFNLGEVRVMEIPLTDGNCVALHWDQTGDHDSVCIGAVNFDVNDASARWHERKWPLKKAKANFNFSIQLYRNGGVGVMDIRDIGRSAAPYKFNINLIPIELTIDGTDLVVSTLLDTPGNNLAPWYGF